ncbi:MAG: S8 family serine peptidase [Dehalococcoidia bacterium]|nr:S8 family serine peptidase [Dehalococcoidia bacterium]
MLIRSARRVSRESHDHDCCEMAPSFWQKRSIILHARRPALTARVFALTVWATCAIVTFPSPVPATEIAQGTTALAPLESFVTEAPHEMLVPSQEDLATVSDCWGASRMHVRDAWRLAGDSQPALVAVLDTGVAGDNPGLSGRICGNVSLVEETDSGEMRDHATHVAATIAAIAPNCTILSIRVADDRGFCTSRAVAEGIDIATRWGASVINLSLEVEASLALEAAIENAWMAGAVVVAAAGMPRNLNQREESGLDTPAYPAAYPRVIAVAGIDQDDSAAPLTNRARWIDVAAPGYRTLAYSDGGQPMYLTGTSTAAAHVSGVAALLCGLAVDRNGDGRVNDEVRRAIEITADRTDSQGLGRGIVDASAAVLWLLS